MEQKNNVQISIVMASYLSSYDGAASDREAKFYRSVRSVQEQSFKQWQLVIVSDGCHITTDMYNELFADDERIKLIEIPKQKQWSYVVRNTGIEASTAQWITYLDTDDFIGKNHLQIIVAQINATTEPIGWVYYNHYFAQPPQHADNALKFDEEIVIIDGKGKCGTCNVTHRNLPEFRWDDDTYLHDWYFIKVLKKHGLYKRIKTPEYYVCHFPNKIDV